MHKAHTGERRCEVHWEFQWRNLRERYHLEDLSIDGRTILTCILKNGIWGCGVD
jgi:hypothetical protein